MEENKRVKPGMKKKEEWSSVELRGAVRLGGSGRCCGIKDAGYKGEQLDGKWRKRRTGMMEYGR